MSWRGSVEDQRRVFVHEVLTSGRTMTSLCHSHGISRKTGYKWVKHFETSGGPSVGASVGVSVGESVGASVGASASVGGLFRDRSRRPRVSPGRTSAAMESRILAIRRAHPTWGSRKIRIILTREGVSHPPSASTITTVLHRHDLIDAESSQKHTPFCRFERATPNELWQMDYKGAVLYTDSSGLRRQCHPLTVLDDHSRYSLCLRACSNERRQTVQECLIGVFREYGLPLQMTMDNGAPWGSDAAHPYTQLTVWLMHLGIRVTHSRPYHPQTQGKDERFHRTLKEDVLAYYEGSSLVGYQSAFDAFQRTYNTERPHQALGGAVPASRYRTSERGYPEQLPAIEYASGDSVRKVQSKGLITLQGREIVISRAFHGYPIALRPTEVDGIMDVYFSTVQVGWIDLRDDEDSMIAGGRTE